MIKKSGKPGHISSCHCGVSIIMVLCCDRMILSNNRVILNIFRSKSNSITQRQVYIDLTYFAGTYEFTLR